MAGGASGPCANITGRASSGDTGAYLRRGAHLRPLICRPRSFQRNPGNGCRFVIPIRNRDITRALDKAECQRPIQAKQSVTSISLGGGWGRHLQRVSQDTLPNKAGKHDIDDTEISPRDTPRAGHVAPLPASYARLRPPRARSSGSAVHMSRHGGGDSGRRDVGVGVWMCVGGRGCGWLDLVWVWVDIGVGVWVGRGADGWGRHYRRTSPGAGTSRDDHVCSNRPW